MNVILCKGILDSCSIYSKPSGKFLVLSCIFKDVISRDMPFQAFDPILINDLWNQVTICSYLKWLASWIICKFIYNKLYAFNIQQWLSAKKRDNKFLLVRFLDFINELENIIFAFNASSPLDPAKAARSSALISQDKFIYHAYIVWLSFRMLVSPCIQLSC